MVNKFVERRKGAFLVSFNNDGTVYYTVSTNRLSLMKKLSPLLTPVFSWLTGYSTVYNGYTASIGSIQASVVFIFPKNYLVEAHFLLSPRVVNQVYVVYDFQVDINGRFPKTHRIPRNDTILFGIALEESILGTIKAQGTVEFADSRVVPVNMVVNYTSDTTLPLPNFDNVFLNAVQRNLRTNNTLSQFTFSSTAQFEFPPAYTLLGNLSLNSETIEYVGRIPVSANSTSRIAVQSSYSSQFDLISLLSIPAILSVQLNLNIANVSGAIDINGNNPVFTTGTFDMDTNNAQLITSFQLSITGSSNYFLLTRSELSVVLLPGSLNVVFVVVLPAGDVGVQNVLPSVFEVITNNKGVPENGLLVSTNLETLAQLQHTHSGVFTQSPSQPGAVNMHSRSTPHLIILYVSSVTPSHITNLISRLGCLAAVYCTSNTNFALIYIKTIL